MSQSFSESRLDPAISLNATVTPMRRTQIIDLAGGSEERVSKWRDSRRKYDIGYAVREADAIARVVAFFEARGGRYSGFRFKDWQDWKSCGIDRDIAPTDQPLGIGDGGTTVFQLIKRYEDGFDFYERPVLKPRTARIAVDGVEVDGFSVDLTTGLVTMAAAPAVDAVLTAGFEFDVPVRFDSDELPATLFLPDVHGIESIVLVEDPRYLSSGQSGLLFIGLGNPLEQLVNIDLPTGYGGAY